MWILLRSHAPNIHSFKAVSCSVKFSCQGLKLTLPYSGVVGFVRSYGKHLVEEKITLNAICPNVVRTNISSDAFYDKLEPRGLITPVENLIKVFDSLLGANEVSGETFEVGPVGTQSRPVPDYMDDETKELCEILLDRGRPLHNV